MFFVLKMLYNLSDKVATKAITSVIPGGNRTIVEDKYTEKHRSRDTIKRKERNGNGNVKQYKARILVLRKTW